MRTSSINIAGHELAEISRWKDCYDCCPPAQLKAMGATYKKMGPFYCFVLPAHDILAFNRAICFTSELFTATVLQEVKAYYRSLGVKRFIIQVPSLSDIEVTEAILFSNDFSYHNKWIKLERTLAVINPPVEHTLFIREALEEDRDVVASIIACSFHFAHDVGYLLSSPIGKKGWHFFMAAKGGAPISVSGLHIHRSTAALTIAATPQYAQGNKAQQAQIHHRMQTAIQQNCSLVTVETGESRNEKPNRSYQNMIKGGFQPVYEKRNYITFLN
ncbi:MAG TPA: hypothetical protein VEY10_14745 [Flavisolibacter sp.]|jgi:hypothetical protein|nr:hypothetical protein [Flavisolibacter sp.]